MAGREPITINAADAAARGIADGDVVQLATGAWYDPVEPGRIGSLDRHGNPNLLTQDKGASRLSQGPSAQSALVSFGAGPDDEVVTRCSCGSLQRPPIRPIEVPEQT